MNIEKSSAYDVARALESELWRNSDFGIIKISMYTTFYKWNAPEHTSDPTYGRCWVDLLWDYQGKKYDTSIDIIKTDKMIVTHHLPMKDNFEIREDKDIKKCAKIILKNVLYSTCPKCQHQI